jgi:molybdate transport system substrate-binding protein
MRIRKWNFTLLCLLVILMGFETKATIGAELEKLTVFAAASTTNAITDIAELFKKSHPAEMRLSFASSSTLAKQIEKGAPADIFLSANPKWMDYLSDKGAILPSSRFDLLGNRIVLIAPADSPLSSLTVDSNLNLANLLGDGRLAMGDPDHVPAGMYGKKAFEKLGLWHDLKDKVARAKDVRAALVLVERGETPLGQVYATDAAISDKVKIVGMFPQDSHPPIIYPVAVVADSKSDADGKFIEFLQSPEAKAVFEKYGFTVR